MPFINQISRSSNTPRHSLPNPSSSSSSSSTNPNHPSILSTSSHTSSSLSKSTNTSTTSPRTTSTSQSFPSLPIPNSARSVSGSSSNLNKPITTPRSRNVSVHLPNSANSKRISLQRSTLQAKPISIIPTTHSLVPPPITPILTPPVPSKEEDLFHSSLVTEAAEECQLDHEVSPIDFFQILKALTLIFILSDG